MVKIQVFMDGRGRIIKRALAERSERQKAAAEEFTRIMALRPPGIPQDEWIRMNMKGKKMPGFPAPRPLRKWEKQMLADVESHGGNIPELVVANSPGEQLDDPEIKRRADLIVRLLQDLPQGT